MPVTLRIVCAILTCGFLLAAAPVPPPTDFGQEAYLKGSNTERKDRYGWSVAASGDTVVVGAYIEDSGATGVGGGEHDESAPHSGAVFVYVRSGSSWVQEAYIKASNTGAGDWFGHSVALSGDTLVVGAPVEASGAAGVDGDQSDNSVLASGAAYVFVRSGSTWSQQAYLKASNPEFSDRFGWSVAIAGDTIAVGAIDEASNATGVDGDQGDNSVEQAGAAYVFERSAGVWSQAAYLKASNPSMWDRFGFSVGTSGDTVVVGAYGEDSDATGVNGPDNQNALNSGAAYVFTRDGAGWVHEAYLKASNTNASDWFGRSVAISGATIVAGAILEDSIATGVNGDEGDTTSQAGAAYVFVRSGSTWSQEAYLKASNTGGGDRFAESVAICVDRVAVGAPEEASNTTGVDGDQTDNSAYRAGAAYVFVRSGSSWSQESYVKGSNTDPSDTFGMAVAVSGDTVVVGTMNEESAARGVDGLQCNNAAEDAGAAYVFGPAPRYLGDRYCSPAVANSTGQPGVMAVLGSSNVLDDDLTLMALRLPPESNIGYFIMGTGTNSFTPPGSSGPICVTPGMLRYLPPVNNALDCPGGFIRVVGSSGPISGAISAGSTWNFQAWHRDGMEPSTLTDAVSVTFQ